MYGSLGSFTEADSWIFLAVLLVLAALVFTWLIIFRKVECPHCSEIFRAGKIKEEWHDGIRDSCCPKCGKPVYSQDRIFPG